MTASSEPPEQQRRTETLIGLLALLASYVAFVLASVWLGVGALVLGGISFGLMLNRP